MTEEVRIETKDNTYNFPLVREIKTTKAQILIFRITLNSLAPLSNFITTYSCFWHSILCNDTRFTAVVTKWNDVDSLCYAKNTSFDKLAISISQQL